MANLNIVTKLNRIIVCGDFCGWDMDKGIEAARREGKTYITVKNMPTGEYKLFSSKSFIAGEVYPKDCRTMSNRYFSGENEQIHCYF